MTTSAVRSSFSRIGQGFVEYVRRVKNDYASVAKDTLTKSRERPLRTGIIGTVVGGFVYAFKTNPTEEAMLNELCERRQQLVLVPHSSQSPVADKELARRNLLLAQSRLHYYNLWFFSLLVSTKYNDQLKTHYAQDANLKSWIWKEYWSNIVDIGFLGSWKNLNRSFIDFDINSDEIASLPSDST